VTGASAGFGRAVTEHALQQGDSVVATLRKPEVLSDLLSKHSSQLLVLSLDVRDPEQIHAACENALERFGRVDVVFNNAGICIINEAEGMSDERGRELFDVLFWGAANVTKEAVKIFRDRNDPPGGRLLQMSSRTALQVVAGVAHYAAAKAALECLSEGLAAELDPSWNIKISIIQPALFRTNTAWSTAVDPVHPAYSDPDLPSRKTRNLYPGELAERLYNGDPKKFARAMYRLAHMDDPPLYLPLHRVAVEAAKARGEGLIQTAEEYASWSKDVYYLDGQN
ncbi:NAD(P)-binding protein, partial [Imleria badia]